jgi:hypothetical protein
MSNPIIAKLKSELCELIDRYSKLDKFTDTIEFENLDDYIKSQMIDQYQAMLSYKLALLNRIHYMEEQLKEKV